MTNTRKIRRTATVVGGAALLATLAACGSSGPSGGGGGGGAGGAASTDKALVWAVNGGFDKIYEQSVADFNKAHPDKQVTLQLFQNDPYKQKLRVAIGAGNGPDVFFGWGGGILKDYVDGGNVVDLKPELDKDAAWKDKFFPNVLKTTTFDGKIYGLPLNGMQPVVLLYNKDVFDKAGVQPPKTWDDLLSLVKTFKDKGITPISLGGASKWPDLMYEEYLVDRVGGPEAFNDVLAGKPNAWSNPAIIKANTMIQQLVDAGAFPKGFSSISYDTGQATALLYTGKAAMHLMGGWDFGSILSSQPNFIKQRKLGWAPFPSVPGGKGDPANIAGNPANFYSVSAKSKHKDAAIEYLKTGVMSDSYVDGLLNTGAVPPIKGLESKLANRDNSDWLQFMYNLTKDAPNFQLSWDQALPPAQADALLTNLDRLFLKQITPQQFSDNMNKASQ